MEEAAGIGQERGHGVYAEEEDEYVDIMETLHEEFVDWEIPEPDEVHDEEDDPTEPSYSSPTNGSSDGGSSSSIGSSNLSPRGSNLYSADSRSNPFQEGEDDAGAYLGSTPPPRAYESMSKRRRVTHEEEVQGEESSRDRNPGRDVEERNRDPDRDLMHGRDSLDPYEEEVRRATFEGRRLWANLSG